MGVELIGGAAAIAVAVELKSETPGEWPLPVAGAVSIICGLAPFVTRASTVTPHWVTGLYVMLFGLTLLALAVRLRQLALEIAAAL